MDIPRKAYMKTIRKNTMSGIYETKTLDSSIHLHFCEWWSGEGADFNFHDDKSISLSMDELQALVSTSYAMGMIDLEEVKMEAQAIIDDGYRREQAVKNIQIQTPTQWFD